MHLRLVGINAESVSCQVATISKASTLTQTGLKQKLTCVGGGRCVTAISRIKMPCRDQRQGKYKSTQSYRCGVLDADRFRAYSTTLHCIALRHAALSACLAFAAYLPIRRWRERARARRKPARGIMHAASLCLSACDLAGRGMDSPVSLERYGETINQKC